MTDKPEFTDMEQRILYQMFDALRAAFSHTRWLSDKIQEDVWASVELETGVSYIKARLYHAEQLWMILGQQYDYSPKQRWLMQEFPTLLGETIGIRLKTSSKEIPEELKKAFAFLDKKGLYL